MTDEPDLEFPAPIRHLLIELGRARNHSRRRPLDESDFDPRHDITDEERAEDELLWKAYRDEGEALQQRIKTRHAAERRALERLDRLSKEQRARRERFTLRCPQDRRSCILYQAFNWQFPAEAPEPGAPTLLTVTMKNRQRRAHYPDWEVSDTEVERERWTPIGCAHGHGSFPRYLPEQVLTTAESGRRQRRITDLNGVAYTEWRPSIP